MYNTVYYIYYGINFSEARRTFMRISENIGYALFKQSLKKDFIKRIPKTRLNRTKLAF